MTPTKTKPTSPDSKLEVCPSQTSMMDDLNQELLEIEMKQSQHYERLPHGDYVIYDSRAKIITFKNKSLQSNELFIYQDLDF